MYRRFIGLFHGLNLSQGCTIRGYDHRNDSRPRRKETGFLGSAAPADTLSPWFPATRTIFSHDLRRATPTGKAADAKRPAPAAATDCRYYFAT